MTDAVITTRAPRWTLAAIPLGIIIVYRLFGPWPADLLTSHIVDIVVRTWSYDAIKFAWFGLLPILSAYVFFGRRAFSALGLTGNFAVAIVLAILSTIHLVPIYGMFGEPTLDLRFYGYEPLNIVILSGITEEIFFRAFLFGFLYRFAGWGFIPAALINFVLFGIGHIYQGEDFGSFFWAFIRTAIGAFWWCWLYAEWRNNLWVPICLHIAMNGAWSVFSMGSAPIELIYVLLSQGAVVLISIMATLWFWKRRGGREVTGKRWWSGEVQ